MLAPHPDDESLGCGGLVALLRHAGTDVRIVFITDGAASHPGYTATSLALRRREEAINAASILGVDEDAVVFLDLPDAGLTQRMSDAVDLLVGEFGAFEPDQLVVPDALEPNHDHAATFQAASRAVRLTGRTVRALTFPVWLWDQWPWTNPLAEPRGRLGRRSLARMTIECRLGFGLTRRFPHVVDISTVHDRKLRAISAHQTQSGSPDEATVGPMLEDVSGGDWLGLLMQGFELFATTHLGPPNTL